MVEAIDLEGEALGEYLRRLGPAPRAAGAVAAEREGGARGPVSRRRAKAEGKQIKELEQQLRHKEKALAETAALLVLRKKANALWGDADDDTDERNEP